MNDNAFIWNHLYIHLLILCGNNALRVILINQVLVKLQDFENILQRMEYV